MKKNLFTVVLNNSFSNDVIEAIEYYNAKKENLGFEFYETLKNKLISLKTDALLYQVRYTDIHCLKVGKFPYLIHYKVDSDLKIVYAFAVICTFKNPDDSWIK